MKKKIFMNRHSILIDKDLKGKSAMEDTQLIIIRC